MVLSLKTTCICSIEISPTFKRNDYVPISTILTRQLRNRITEKYNHSLAIKIQDAIISPFPCYISSVYVNIALLNLFQS